MNFKNVQVTVGKKKIFMTHHSTDLFFWFVIHRWAKDEDQALRRGVDLLGAKNWKRISDEFLGGKRTDVQCLHRWQKVSKKNIFKNLMLKINIYDVFLR